MTPSAPPKMLPEVIPPDLLKLPDRVSDTFQDKTVFITGGTGLIGQVLLDKLLRCCRGVKRIYLLVRPKRGKTVEERIDDLFESPLFALLKSDKTNDYRSKIRPIEGDISLEGLGISSYDREILTEEVNIVYHSAANVRFDRKFKEMIVVNVRGCKFMLELANEIKNLQLYVHVSTAYAHTSERTIEEKMYDAPVNPHDVLKLIELLSENMLETVASKYMGDCPQNYSFSKACGESLVNEEIRRGRLPLMLVRPSVVVPTVSHPLPGWINNKHGPMGLTIGTGKGVVRTFYMPKKTQADFLAVDVAANFLCVVAFAYTFFPEKRKDLTVVNFTTSSKVKLIWHEFVEMAYRIGTTHVPLNWVLWYPSKPLTACYYEHKINFVLKQFVPALFVDGILFCCGIKPVLVKIQTLIYNGYDAFEFYTSNEWKFVNDKICNVYSNMLNDREIATYPGCDQKIALEQYYINAAYGARRFLLNEPDETLPTARRHIKVMYVVDKLFQLLLVYFVYCVVCKLVY